MAPQQWALATYSLTTCCPRWTTLLIGKHSPQTSLEVPELFFLHMRINKYLWEGNSNNSAILIVFYWCNRPCSCLSTLSLKVMDKSHCAYKYGEQSCWRKTHFRTSILWPNTMHMIINLIQNHCISNWDICLLYLESYFVWLEMKWGSIVIIAVLISSSVTILLWSMTMRNT